MLAIGLATFGAGAAIAVKAIAGGILYAAFMLTLGRRRLVRLCSAPESAGHSTLNIQH